MLIISSAAHSSDLIWLCVYVRIHVFKLGCQNNLGQLYIYYLYISIFKSM